MSRSDAADEYIMKLANIMKINKITIDSERNQNYVDCLERESYEHKKEEAVLTFLMKEDSSFAQGVSSASILALIAA